MPLPGPGGTLQNLLDVASMSVLSRAMDAAGHPALLVIDCQADFGSPDGEMARRGMDMTAPQAALGNAESLVEAARAAAQTPVLLAEPLDLDDIAQDGFTPPM